MDDIHLINTRLSSQLYDFIDCFVKNENFDLKDWLKENEINTEDNKRLKILNNYLVASFQLFREIWMEPEYENYWEAREFSKIRFRKLDNEIKSLIKSNSSV
jgi:hypothetical protein